MAILDPTNPNLNGVTPENLLKSRFNYSNLSKVYLFDEEEEGDKAIAYSYLGTPVLSNVQFEVTNYRDFNDVEYTFGGFTLDICLISATSENLIVETVVQGSNYSKFESINSGNYRITVNGFLDSKQMNVAPYVLMKQLKDMKNVNISIKINSDFLNTLDVFEVVCNSFEYSQIEGTRNLIAVSMSLTSDEPIEVRLA